LGPDLPTKKWGGPERKVLFGCGRIFEKKSCRKKTSVADTWKKKRKNDLKTRTRKQKTSGFTATGSYQHKSANQGQKKKEKKPKKISGPQRLVEGKTLKPPKRNTFRGEGGKGLGVTRRRTKVEKNYGGFGELKKNAQTRQKP